MCQKNRQENERLKDALKEILKYAKILKIGLDRNDAKYVEAEQIEIIIQNILKEAKQWVIIYM